MVTYNIMEECLGLNTWMLCYLRHGLMKPKLRVYSV